MLPADGPLGLTRLIALPLMAVAALLAGPVSAPAQGTTRPGRAQVIATPGFGGRWAVQQWAPLRLGFLDPGPVRAVELFCDDAGPVFRAPTVPAPTGESFIDLAVYAQVESRHWTVRLIGADGAVREVPVRLEVDFSGPTCDLAVSKPGRSRPGFSPLQATGFGMGGSVFRSPPRAMWLAAARSVRARGDDAQAVAFLATGRELELADPRTGSTRRLSLVETFGRPSDQPLVNAAFYRVVWPEQFARWPEGGRRLPLAVLAGGLLAVVVVGLLARGRTGLAAVLSAGVLVAAAGGLWLLMRAERPLLAVQIELVVRPGQMPGDGRLPAPVRRQRWHCVAAHRGGRFELPPANPTPRLVVADVADRPDVVLPAAWRTDPPKRGAISARRGEFWAFDSTHYSVEFGTMRLLGDRVVWRDWTLPLAEAYLVSDTRAVPLGSVGGGSGEAAVDRTRQVAWGSVYVADDRDSLPARLGKRLLKYWSTRTPRGGRRWVVGWRGADNEARSAGRPRDGHVRLPALYVVDLGPIEAGPAARPSLLRRSSHSGYEGRKPASAGEGSPTTSSND